MSINPSTLIVHGRVAMRTSKLAAARSRRHGLRVMTFEQLAVRLAGGFTQAIDADLLRAAIQTALPTVDMGELEAIKNLPGMVSAAVDTLRKAWHAGIELTDRAGQHPRLAAMARLEKAVLEHLPKSMLRPMDIVAAAMGRLAHAPAVLGTVEIAGLTELEPCWQALLVELVRHVPVQWNAGPRTVPGWLEGSAVNVVIEEAQKPEVNVVSCATAYHEAIEALRWARQLLAAGVKPADIAIAAASPSEYDDQFLALRADANLEIHFVHGVRTVTTREGQAAAALADIIVRGLSRTKLRRLAVLSGEAKAFRSLPDGWFKVLPSEAPLGTLSAWLQYLSRLQREDWPDGIDHTPTLRAAIELLDQGTAAVDGAGEAFLSGRALVIWRKAQKAGPATSIDMALAQLKHDDGLEACVSVAWMPASALAASPRPYVRLIGLNSSRWPRGIVEDRLIPDHIVPTGVIDPLSVNLADRRDFDTILKTSAKQLVLSRSRRDMEGRLLGRSPLLARYKTESYLQRHAVPVHAFSETDRLMARPAEFAKLPQAESAMGCWRNWRRSELTAHDGLVRGNHPLLLKILDRTQSASSLKRLLRNPLSFLWTYGFHWSAPDASTEPLIIEPSDFGDLVHRALDDALRELDGAGGVTRATDAEIAAAIERASNSVAVQWELESAVPPEIIWQQTKYDVRDTAFKALTFRDKQIEGACSYGEVPFGGLEPRHGAKLPWDASAPVVIPGSGFNIAGYIDRLDVSADVSRALVRDYKTGKPPRTAIRLNGGSELQRCLYGFAVKALLGEEIAISASLLYPRADVNLELDNPQGAMTEIAAYLKAARESLAAGTAVLGPDTGGNYDELAFALPANAGATYCKRKAVAMAERLADLAPLWSAE